MCRAVCEAQVQTFESCYYTELAFEKVKQTITQIHAMLEYLLNVMNAIKRLGLWIFLSFKGIPSLAEI